MKHPYRSILRSALPAIGLAAIGLVLAAAHASAQWTDLPRIADQERTNSFVSYLDGKLYVFGGLTASGGPTKQSHAFDVAGGSWSRIADMPEPRFYGFAAAVGGRIYLFGGVAFRNGQLPPIGTVLEYDPVANTYTAKASMPIPTYYASGTVVGTKVYIFGGMNAGSPGAMVQMYDVATDTWSQLDTPLPLPVIGSAATTVGATIFLVGGSGATISYAAAFKGTLSANGLHITWTPIAPYPTPIYQGAAGSYKGRIYVAGGVTESEPIIDRVYYYDEGPDRWRSAYWLPVPAINNAANLPGSGNELYFVSANNGSGRVLRYDESALEAVADPDRTRVTITMEPNASASESIILRNTGIVALNGTITIPPEAAAWLAVGSPTVSVEAGEFTRIVLTASSAGLAPGNYSAHCVLATNDATRPAIGIDVLVVVREHLTVERPRIVIEEATGDWCGNCPAATRLLDAMLSRNDSNLTVIAYHGGSAAEPMKIEDGSNILWYLGERAFPMAAVNRTAFAGESVPMVTLAKWNPYADSIALETHAAASIALANVTYDGARLHGTFTVTADDALPLADSAGYAVTIVATEDSVVGSQIEYADTGTIHHELWYHNHVARAVFPDWSGLPLEFPPGAVSDSAVMPNGTASGTFDFLTNVRRADLGRFIVMVHGRRGNEIGPLLQALDLPLPQATSSVRAATGDAALSLADPVPNPASASVSIDYTLRSAGAASLALYSSIGTIVQRIALGNLPAGTHSTRLYVASLPSGTYRLALSAGGRTVTCPLAVVR